MNWIEPGIIGKPSQTETTQAHSRGVLRPTTQTGVKRFRYDPTTTRHASINDPLFCIETHALTFVYSDRTQCTEPCQLYSEKLIFFGKWQPLDVRARGKKALI